MSRRLLTGGGAAALALVLALPSAALADDESSKNDKKGKGAAATTADDGHNPPGNNGTIKIDYAAPADSGNANRPHPGCAFQLRMFGFDDEQYGDITFVGQAPTKHGTLLTQTHVLLSDDDAGGGQDVDAVYSYTAEQLGLIGKPKAKQGWHVKVSVDAENAPGGAKHKVFWLQCPTTTTAGTTQGGSTVTTKTVGTTAGTATASGTATTVTSSTVNTASRSGTTAGTVAGAAEATAGFTGGAAVARTAAQPAAETEGSALPFTGIALSTMIALALGALTAGALAVRAGRRRTAEL